MSSSQSDRRSDPSDTEETLRRAVQRAHDDLARAEHDYEVVIGDDDVIQEDRDGARQAVEAARGVLLSAQRRLDQFEAGTYGRCRVCGGPIGEERLEAIPGVTTCVNCA